nr:MAG TPA: KilAC domain protein [Caudoviricetes sp.]
MFGDIRTVGTAENPLFCLADLCRVLELQVTPTKNRLDQRGVNSIKVGVQTGVKKDGSPAMQDVDMTFVNEKNLCKVIMRSDKPQAEPFQDWVCGDVLPTLRKTGSYLITTDQVSRKDLALMIIKAEEEKERLALENKNQAEIIESQKPAVVFTDAVKGSDSSCLVGELAKLIKQNGYDIGEKRLFKWLRENGYLSSHGERYNIPNQRWAHLFELKKGVRSGDNGAMHTTITTKVNGKGQVYFINLFSKKTGKEVAV